MGINETGTPKMTAPKPPQAEESEMEKEDMWEKLPTYVDYNGALPPAAKPSDTTDEEAAWEWCQKRYDTDMEAAGPYQGFLAGASRVRALVGKEIGELKFRWENTKAYQFTLEARIKELERNLAEAMSGCCDCPMFKSSQKLLAEQAKLLDLAEKAFSDIKNSAQSPIDTDRKSKEALAAIKAGRAK